MKSAGLFLALLVLVNTVGCGRSASRQATVARTPTVGFVIFAPDPATDRAIQGVKDGLKEQGYEEGKNIRFESNDAQADMPTLQSIGQKYIGENVDIIVPLTTPSLVATANVVKGTDHKVVFTEVYDPYAAGVAVSPKEHPRNLSGVASPPPVGAILDLIKELTPRARKIGTIYNPAEANSVSSTRRLREAVAPRGFTLVERTVAGSNEVQQAAQSLVGQVDTICIVGDNTVQVSLDAVVKAADAARLPIYVADPPWVERGPLAAVGPDFYDAGRAAAGMIARVLKGADLATMEIQTVDTPELVLNRKAAAKLGITLPQAVVSRAKKVLE
jgi:putative tryptophan/tyrosine transport system substrate-binding protein